MMEKGSLELSRKQKFLKFLGSSIALVLGWLCVLAGISAIGRSVTAGSPPDSPFLLHIGIMVLLGTSAYRSMKKRHLGLLPNSQIRMAVEALMIGLVILGFALQKNFSEVIVSDPITRLIIPLMSIEPYFHLLITHPKRGERTMKKSTLLFVFIVLAVIGTFPVLAGKKVLNNEDAKYMLDGFKADKGGVSIDPLPPSNEKQEILHDMMNEVATVETEHAQAVEAIGPVDLDSMMELSEMSQLKALRTNLVAYRQLREKYYEDKAALTIKWNKKLGVETRPDGRLPDSFTYRMELLEYEYYDDLKEFYDYVIFHHNELVFQDGQVYIDSDETLNTFNKKWESAVQSATEMVNFQEEARQTLSEGLNKAKDGR